MLRRTAAFCAALAIHAIANAETVPWGYRDVASAFGIPAETLYGIAKTESNEKLGDGFQVTAYTQTWSDVEAKIGDRAKAGQVAGNFNTLIMLRVKELATAEMLTDQIEMVEVHSLMQVSGVSDADGPGDAHHFQSSNEDRLGVTEAPLKA